MGPPETIVLDDVPETVWRAFQEGRDGPRGRSPAYRAHLERWARARSLGASPEGTRVDDALIRGEDLRLRGEHVDMLQSLGAATFARAVKRVSEHDFVLLLADADGVVVRSEGGGAFRDEARRVRLIEGASWSEDARGTNAIGTAASERRPAVVLGRAHFARSYHRLACYAAPVLDAEGRLAAVLDATSTVEHAVPQVGAAVFAAAQVLGELLRLEAYAGAGSSVLRVLARSLERCDRPALLVEPPGRIARMNAAARERLGGAFAGGPVRALLGLSWTALVDEALAPTPGGRPIPRAVGAGAAPVRLHAEPVLDAGGRALAVLLHLEPALARRAAPRPRLPAEPAGADEPFAPIFAEDRAVREAIDWARLVAASELPVMLLAETGAGKELFAQAIHAASPRAEGPFVAVNCGAVAPSLLESELFGYAPSAFTGADRRGRTGLFHAASGGTLFLDEVAEMPLAMQAALLRTVESGAFHRVGAARTERCDVRVVCATCRDLDRAVDEGSFRRDLYYRLKGAALRLPPLRERRDLLPLARRLLVARAERAGFWPPPALSAEAEGRLAAHGWPGNVRELVSTLDVALVAARGHGATEITPAHLPGELARAAPPPAEAPPARGSLRRAEAGALRRALDRHGGNVSAAARELGVARSTLYRLARRHAIPIGRRHGR